MSHASPPTAAGGPSRLARTIRSLLRSSPLSPPATKPAPRAARREGSPALLFEPLEPRFLLAAELGVLPPPDPFNKYVASNTVEQLVIPASTPSSEDGGEFPDIHLTGAPPPPPVEANAAAELGLVDEGLRAFFDELQEELDATVFDAPVPLIGSQLASEEPGQFADDISTLLDSFNIGSGGTIADVTGGLESELGSLIDGSIDVAGVDGAKLIQFQLTLHESMFFDNALAVDLALGDDAFMKVFLDNENKVDITIDYTLNLSFGVDEGSFFVSTTGQELVVDLFASIDSTFEGKGPIGVFAATIAQGDDPGDASTFNGTYAVDISDAQAAGADGRLTLADMSDLALQASLTGTGSADLDIDASFVPDFLGDDGLSDAERGDLFNLRVFGDVQITYDFTAVDTQVAVADFGDDPVIEFLNLQLDTTEYLGGFFSPIIETLRPIFEPLQPVFDLLDAPVPGLSDLSEAVGAGQVTFSTLAGLSNPSLGATLNTLSLINTLVSSELPGREPSGPKPDDIDLGSFKVIAEKKLGGKAKKQEDNPDMEAKGKAEKSSKLSAKVSGDLRFPLLDDPSNIFALLRGESDIEMFGFGVDIDFRYTFSVKWPTPIPLLSVNIKLAVGLAVDLDFGYDTLGVRRLSESLDWSARQALVDSLHENQSLLREGYFFDDHLGAGATDGDLTPPNLTLGGVFVDGPPLDGPELKFFASISVGASLGPDLGIAALVLGVDFPLKLDILFDLNDLPNRVPVADLPDPPPTEFRDFFPADPADFEYDGRVRLTELDLIVRSDPLAIFHSQGELSVAVQFFLRATIGIDPLKLTLVDKRWDLVKFTLLTFDILTPLPDEQILEGVIARPPKVASEADANGVVTLFMGPEAGRRENTSLTGVGRDFETDEAFRIKSLGLTDENDPDGGETLEITYLGKFAQTVTKVKKVVASGGSGDDSIAVDDGVAAAVDFSGGAGEDDFTYRGDGDAILSGGSDNDKLSYRGTGRARLLGGAGNDELSGGPNDDVLIGGDDLDESGLEGGVSGDFLRGNGGDDIILGDEGSVSEGGTVSLSGAGAGPGNDVLIGDVGEDQLFGQRGDDSLDGGKDADITSGGAGNDRFLWNVGDGSDTITESSGTGDELVIGGGQSIVGEGEDASAFQFVEADDQITIGGNAGNVAVDTPTDALRFNGIERINVAAGGGSDTVVVSTLAGTDVERMAIDLGQLPGSAPGLGDSVIYNGVDGSDDAISVQGALQATPQTDLENQGNVLPDVETEVVQIDDDTAQSLTLFLANTDVASDALTVNGRGGEDRLSVVNGSDGLRVRDLIHVTLDGGDDDDTLSTVYGDTTIIGGGGNDLVVLGEDDANGARRTITLGGSSVLVERAGLADDLMALSSLEDLTLTLGTPGAGNTLDILATPVGQVTIGGSTGNDDIRVEAIDGNTTINLAASSRAITNTVTLGQRDGAPVFINADLTIAGSAGFDRVTYDSTDDATARPDVVVGVTSVSGLAIPATSLVTYDAAVEEIELLMGLGATQIVIPDLTRRVTVRGSSAEDSVSATLLGKPTGGLNDPPADRFVAGGNNDAGLETFDVESVAFSNDANTAATDWLLTDTFRTTAEPAVVELRSGTEGVFDPLNPGAFDQVLLRAHDAPVTTLNLSNGTGADTLRVWDIASETHVNLRGGTDQVIVGDSRADAPRGFADIDSPLFLDGGDDGDTLQVDDRANTLSGVGGLIDGTRITGFNMGAGASIDHAGFTRLTVDLAGTSDIVTVAETSIKTVINVDPSGSGGGDDQVTIEGASAETTIALGSGSDTVIVTGASAAVVIDGGNSDGQDLIVFDVGDETGPLGGAQLAANGVAARLSGLGAIADVTFERFEQANLILGSNSDELTLDLAVPGLIVMVDAGSGDDTVIVKRIGGTTRVDGQSGVDTLKLDIPGDPGAPLHDNLFANLRVQAEKLVVDNAAFGGGAAWITSNGVLSGNGSPLVFTDGADELRILAGSGSDTLTVEEQANPVVATIDGAMVGVEAGKVVLESGEFNTFDHFGDVIDFDAFPTSVQLNPLSGEFEYAEDGFTLSARATNGTDTAFMIRDTAISSSARLLNGSTLRIVPETSAGFALHSVQLAKTTDGTRSVQFRGFALNGNGASFLSDPIAVTGGEGFQTVELDARFTALSRVEVVLGTDILIDNIVAEEMFDTVAATGLTAADGGFTPGGQAITFFTDSRTVQIGNGPQFSSGDFNGTPMTSQFLGNVTQYRFAGDLNIGSFSSVRVVGSNGLSLFASNDVNIGTNVSFDVSGGLDGNNRSGVAGAGVGGTFGEPGEGGSGGGRGFNTESGEVGEEGEGGRGGDATFTTNFGGENGESGTRGDDGGSGFDGFGSSTGNAGTDGINGGENGAGGTAGTPGEGGQNTEAGEWGEGGEAGGGGGGGGGTTFGDGGTPGGGEGGERGNTGRAGNVGFSGGGGERGTNEGASTVISGGGAGGAGGGGGGGGGSGGGGAGGGGGGGGGEGAHGVSGGSGGESGGVGAHGLTGNTGGVGGTGGEGGAGGGAFEVMARGRVTVAGSSALQARGASGESGSGGGGGGGADSGTGSDREDGSTTNEGGEGGDGGGGGGTGAGGTGGSGGTGGGGAGGTVKLYGSVINAGGSVNTEGGSGAEIGEDGRFIVGKNNNRFSTSFEPAASGAFRSEFEGFRDGNLNVLGTPDTPFIAGMLGGAEVSGLLGDVDQFTTAFINTVEANAPVGAMAAVVRMDIGPDGFSDDYTGFDMVLFINLTDITLEDPMLGITRFGVQSDFTDVLRIGGIATDTAFGGSGDGTVITGLGADQVWATLIPDDGGNVTRFNATIADGPVTPINRLALADGQLSNLNYIVAPQPDLALDPGLSGIAAVAASPNQDLVYAVNPAQDALVVANADDLLSQRQLIKDGIAGVDGLDGASDVAVSPDGASVYVVSHTDRAIATFSFNPSTQGLDFERFDALGSNVFESVVVSADGNRVYTAGPSGLSAWDRDSSTGDLSLNLGPFSFTGITGYADVAVSADSTRLYSVSEDTDQLLNMAANAGFGAQIFDISASVNGPSAIALSDDDRFVYVAGEDSSTVAVFQRPSGSGSLSTTPVQVLREGVDGIRGIAGANGVEISKEGDFVYVTGGAGNTLAVFERDADTGELSFAQVLRGRLGLESPTGLTEGLDGAVFVGSESGLGIADGGIAAFDPISLNPVNVALNPAAIATQSSISAGGLAERAIDGNTDGNYSAGSVTHTDNLPDSFWEVELGALHLVDDIVLHNRADCCGERLSNFSVSVFDGDQEIFVDTFFTSPGTSVAQGASLAIEVPDDVEGDRVRVQLLGLNDAGNGVLSLAEVQVFGSLARDLFKVSFESTEALNLNTGAQDDVVRQINAAHVGTLVIDTDGGFDQVDLLNVAGDTTVRTGSEADQVSVRSDDSSSVVASVRIETDGGDDFVNVRGTGPANLFTILTGTGNDTIQVAGDELASGSQVQVLGGGDFDTLLFDRGGRPITPSPPPLGAGTVRINQSGFGLVDYQSIEAIPGFEAATADAGGPYLINEGISGGGTLVLAGSATPATSTTIVSQSWDLDGDGGFGDATGLSPALTWSDLQQVGIADHGVFDITLRVTDDLGVSTFDTVTLTVTNTAPVLDVSGGPDPVVGASYELDFSAEDPGDDSVFEWRVDWGDGTVETFASDATSARHAYLDTGAAIISVTAQDEDGLFGPETVGLTVRAPVPNTGGPYAINEGEDLLLAASAVGDPLLEWDLDGDGQYDDGPNGVVSWATLNDLGIDDDGQFNLSVRSTYAGGGSSQAATSVQVVNVAPSATLTNDGPVSEGAPLTLSFTGESDPSPADESAGFTYSFDFDNDGTFETSGSAATAVVPGSFLTESGLQVFRGLITDDDGGSTELFTSAAVLDVAPTLNLDGADNVDEGSAYRLSLSADDPGDDVISQWTVNWGDGAQTILDGATVEAEHVYIDDGAFNISVSASDGDGLHRGSRSVTVDNVAPELTLAGLTSLDEGDALTLFLQATDPGADAIATWSVDWGDGTVDTVAGNQRQAVHVYVDDGTYDVTASASDEDGTFQVTRVTMLSTPLALFDGGADATEHFYQLTTGASDRAAARAAALARGGDLVSITTQGEQDFIDATFSSDPSTSGGVWIGLQGLSAATPSWSTGEAVTFENFAAGEPDGDGDFAINVFDEQGLGQWFDRDGGAPIVADHFGLIELDSLAGLPTEASTTLQVEVGNTAPSATLSAQATVQEGGIFTLTISPPVDPGDDTVTAIEVNFGDGTLQTFDAPSADAEFDFVESLAVTHEYADGDTTHTVSVSLVDEDGTHLLGDTLEVGVTNVSPTVSLGGAATVLEGDTYTLSLDAVTDPGADMVTSFLIKWGDGDSDTVNALGDVSHVYLGAAEHTITVDLLDEDGMHEVAGTLAVTVVDVPPTLVLQAPASVNEGDLFVLSITDVVDPGTAVTGTPDEFVIDWGDGNSDTVAGDTTSIGHVYADGNFNYSVTVDVVSNGDTFVDAGALQVLVANVSPTIALTGDAGVREGEIYTLTLGAITDPGDDTISGTTVNWGDGSVDTFTAPGDATHVYGSGGPQMITVDLRDEDGLHLAAATKNIQVADIVPSIPLSGAASVAEGSPYTLTLGVATDVNSPDPIEVLEYVVDWGDGMEESVFAAGDVMHTYADGPAAHTISVDLVLAAGTFEDVATQAVSVDDVAPTIAISGDPSVNEGDSFTLSLGAITDPGDDTVTAYIVKWGDGSSDTFTAPGDATHTYGDGDATRTVSVDLVDEDGTHEDAGTLDVEVRNVSPSIALSGAPNVTVGESYTLELGTVTDPGADTVTAYVVTWGDGTTESFPTAGPVTHTYTTDGPKTIRVDLVDEDGTHSAAGALAVTVDPAPARFVPVTDPNVAVAQSNALYNRLTRQYVSTVSITNNTGLDIPAQFRVVLVGANKTLATGAHGQTGTGEDFFVVLGGDGAVLAAGSTLSVDLAFAGGRGRLVYEVRLESMATQAQPLTGAAHGHAGSEINQADLDLIGAEALRRWAHSDLAGIDARRLAERLDGVTLRIADLPGTRLGEADGQTITIDVDAAGMGWFVDRTPGDDHEFQAGNGASAHAVDGPARDAVDLLSVVTHELGHVLGRFDLSASLHPDDVMTAVLGEGMRRVPLVDDGPGTGSDLSTIGRLHPAEVESGGDWSAYDAYLMTGRVETVAMQRSPAGVAGADASARHEPLHGQRGSTTQRTSTRLFDATTGIWASRADTSTAEMAPTLASSGRLVDEWLVHRDANRPASAVEPTSVKAPMPGELATPTGPASQGQRGQEPEVAPPVVNWIDRFDPDTLRAGPLDDGVRARVGHGPRG